MQTAFWRENGVTISDHMFTIHPTSFEKTTVLPWSQIFARCSPNIGRALNVVLRASSRPIQVFEGRGSVTIIFVRNIQAEQHIVFVWLTGLLAVVHSAQSGVKKKKT